MSNKNEINLYLKQVLRIASTLVPAKNWYEIHIKCAVVESITEVKSWYCLSANGIHIEYNTFDLDYINEDAEENDIGQFIIKIREATADAIRGAWYSITISYYHYSDQPIIQYNYYDEPAFTLPIPLTIYKKDLKLFPRASQHIPLWLK